MLPRKQKKNKLDCWKIRLDGINSSEEEMKIVKGANWIESMLLLENEKVLHLSVDDV